MSLAQKLEKLWERDVFNREEILVPAQWRVLRRCDHRDANGKRCVAPALWRVRGFYDGRLEFVRYFCSDHIVAWDESLAEDEQRGVLSQAWSYDVKRMVSRKTLRRWLRRALILHGL